MYVCMCVFCFVLIPSVFNTPCECIQTCTRQRCAYVEIHFIESTYVHTYFNMTFNCLFTRESKFK